MEYQCHGSKAVVAALIAALVAQPGLRPAEPGEFTRRALANGRIDLTQAEGLAELLEAESEAQRISALRRSEGELRRQVERWRARAARAVGRGRSRDRLCRRGGWRRRRSTRRRASPRSSPRSTRLLAAPRVERLRDGVRVVVAGPPNAGKSSLVNALAGEARAIVTAIPGTTRDLVEVPLSIGGIPLTLVDTAGLRESGEEVERIGIGLAEREIERADLLLWLGDAADAPDHPHTLLVASKADLQRDALGLTEYRRLTGEGLDGPQGMDRSTSAQTLVPSTEQPGVNAREADLLDECRDAAAARIAARRRRPDRRGTAHRADRARPRLGHIRGGRIARRPVRPLLPRQISFTWNSALFDFSPTRG